MNGSAGTSHASTAPAISSTMNTIVTRPSITGQVASNRSAFDEVPRTEASARFETTALPISSPAAPSTASIRLCPIAASSTIGLSPSTSRTFSKVKNAEYMNWLSEPPMPPPDEPAPGALLPISLPGVPTAAVMSSLIWNSALNVFLSLSRIASMGGVTSGPLNTDQLNAPMRSAILLNRLPAVTQLFSPASSRCRSSTVAALCSAEAFCTAAFTTAA